MDLHRTEKPDFSRHGALKATALKQQVESQSACIAKVLQISRNDCHRPLFKTHSTGAVIKSLYHCKSLSGKSHVSVPDHVPGRSDRPFQPQPFLPSTNHYCRHSCVLMAVSGPVYHNFWVMN